ncbi:unnamed protein product [Peronospora destructor]|uniref:Uncharacterized protein n=1 Tax=Peronospora destructor TaxID=86335 RepID=A0AAV0TZX8_9STRA|nr:unnamed protein product [Peronospora destructor]
MTDDDTLDAVELSGDSNGDTSTATTEPAPAAAIATANRSEIGMGGNGGINCITMPDRLSMASGLNLRLLQLEWMPLWAAQRGGLFVLKQLHFVKHPQLFIQQTFEAIMRYTKAGNSLQWFQAHSPTLTGDLSIVKWGVSSVWIPHIFLKVPAAELHAKLGRLTIWKDALLAAARCGQTEILWLHEMFAFSATYLRVLPQMQRREEISFVSTSGLLEAMVNCHVDVVQWVCAVDVDLVSQQTLEWRGELATFLREFPSKLGFVFPPL